MKRPSMLDQLTVHCHAGSLEKEMDYADGNQLVHCHAGSLEMYFAWHD